MGQNVSYKWAVSNLWPVKKKNPKKQKEHAPQSSFHHAYKSC